MFTNSLKTHGKLNIDGVDPRNYALKLFLRKFSKVYESYRQVPKEDDAMENQSRYYITDLTKTKSVSFLKYGTNNWI